MPNGDVSGEIKVTITGEPGAEGAPGAPRLSPESRETARGQKLQTTASVGMFRQIMRVVPWLMGAVGIAGILKQSKIISTFMSTTFTLLGSVVDMFLAPFIPILASIFQALSPHIQEMYNLWNATISPIIKDNMPAIRQVIESIFNLLNVMRPIIEGMAKSLDLVFKGMGLGLPTGLTKAEQYWWPLKAGQGGEIIKQISQPSLFQRLVNWITGKQFGGFIPSTGLYHLHSGEEVISSKSVYGRSKGVSIGNMNMTITTDGLYDEEHLGRIIINEMMEELDNRTRRWL